MSINGTGVHIHTDDIGSQFNLLVVNLTLSIEMSPPTLGEEDRVVGLVSNRGLEWLLLGSRRIDTQCILKIGVQLCLHTPTLTHRNRTRRTEEHQKEQKQRYVSSIFQ